MLFISRYFGRDAYGVVDTDDGVEEIVPYSTLQDACTAYDLDIKGASYSGTKFENYLYRFVNDICPYQPIETVTTLQTKIKMLRHVEVLTYKDMITSICWKPYELSEPVSIRLSDFGHVCTDFFLENNLNSRTHTVTLVIDDSVIMSEYSLLLKREKTRTGIGDFGVVVDVREVTNLETLKLVYSSLRYLFAEFGCLVTDHQERFEAMRRLFQ